MKTLILIDRPNWAYHSIALGITKYGNIDADILPIKKGVDKIKKVYKKYDQFFVMGWQTFRHVNFLPKENTLTGIHGHHAWDDRKTTPEKDVEPPGRLHDYLRKFKGVNCVSERLQRLFPYASYTPNGVDTEIFFPRSGRDLEGPVVVGCAYNPKHDWRKGVREFIEPAANIAGARLELAPKDRKMHDMPRYYHGLDMYICASSSEGMSLSVLEAMACGIPIITTWPEFGDVIVKRNVKAIAQAINAWPKYTVIPFIHSWESRAKAWGNFINGTTNNS